MTRALLRIALVGVALVGAQTARADGLPVAGIDAGGDGVPASDGSVRYVTFPGAGGTVVAKIQQRGGQVSRSTILPGTLVLPIVAYDKSVGGLSADGRTLVVLRPRIRFPRTRTTLAILEARRLHVRAFITLRGDFSFDALSPDGRWLYLIQYIAPKDPTQYAVRVYDVRARHLLPAPVVDPDTWGKAMHGSPITRATSADGRWAYTLYDGVGVLPFVHALDTRQRRAVCVDLPMLARRGDLFTLKLSDDSDGGSLTVTSRGRPVVRIDTRTFEVSRPSTSTESFPWRLVAALAGALVAPGALVLTVRRWRRAGLLAPERAG